jgi:hypothetical protein
VKSVIIHNKISEIIKHGFFRRGARSPSFKKTAPKMRCFAGSCSIGNLSRYTEFIYVLLLSNISLLLHIFFSMLLIHKKRKLEEIRYI